MKIICIGDVNTMRHIDKLYEILPNTKYIECYTLEELEKKMNMPMISNSFLENARIVAQLLHQFQFIKF